MELPDEEKQLLKLPQLLCPSGEPITSICTTSGCKSSNAFYCDCNVCIKNHMTCSSGISCKVLPLLVSEKTILQRKLLFNMKEMVAVYSKRMEK